MIGKSQLLEVALKHFQKKTLSEVFGRSEQQLYQQLSRDNSVASSAGTTPVFYIDHSFNVYPNFTAPLYFWSLGNLKKDGVQAVLENYAENKSLAQHIRATVPLCEIVKSQGDPGSQRLFTQGDYITYVLNRYCRSK